MTDPEVAPSAADVERMADEMLAYVAVRAGGDAVTGPAAGFFEADYLFGGLVLAQAVAAGHHAAPLGTRMHSLHAYFLRPIAAAEPVEYQITPVRQGRTFTQARLEAFQGDKPALTMMCSFTADTGGYVYDLLRGDDVPGPEDGEEGERPGPWEASYLGPTEPDENGVRTSTHRLWTRFPRTLPDDSAVHTALVTFVTDWTGIGGRPLHLEGDTAGMISLDHAVWFHRPLRVDDWIYYDVHSVVNAGGRGFLRGAIFGPDRRLAVSVAQEMLLRPADE